MICRTPSPPPLTLSFTGPFSPVKTSDPSPRTQLPDPLAYPSRPSHLQPSPTTPLTRAASNKSSTSHFAQSPHRDTSAATVRHVPRLEYEQNTRFGQPADSRPLPFTLDPAAKANDDEDGECDSGDEGRDPQIYATLGGKMAGTDGSKGAEEQEEEQTEEDRPARPDLSDEEMVTFKDAVRFEWSSMNKPWALPGPWFPWDNRVNSIIFCHLVQRPNPLTRRTVQEALDMCKALHPDDKLPFCKTRSLAPPGFPASWHCQSLFR